MTVMTTIRAADEPWPMERTKVIGDLLRRALREHADTVSVISTEVNGQRHGIVATATMSVCLEPPLIMVGVNRSSSIHGPLTTRGAFCVNTLHEGQQDIGQMFFVKKGEERFSLGAWTDHKGAPGIPAGLPFLPSAQSSIFCRVRQSLDYGTHTVFLGEVEDVVQGSQVFPLIYHDGRYRSLASTQGQ